ncbi:response regulator transcription factor [Leuconostoc mesenteroides]|uniref:response regulator transcription factor n=1 Tax=Leuconostoc mesenteroides TaxID=1245 RepID=UPI0009FC5107|nr:response regulator transcription factor [Leuconostoc mesenteroides]ORI48405.1 DNA-binding response regulator [Leuconostoc mesenteroides subsp. cremoris]ORI49395.1 DNA-binding response regulator [Leuconostoc mesenteroides subsp. cremoris]ORI51161.1 DNA-binding response regulator [Leuconostoc mesenteroides subsp. cremoris]ORI57684.1 DNA-binding response regulator [Leuconostoc mesenteroides subsp. cremoris]ORI60678.1 DNA-binding response regulator [Leuconostoc mesenteroides subsp. cremoris]
MTKILVVDDETAIATLLQYNLQQNGYELTVASDGLSAYQKAKEQQFNAILLDLMLPEMDGLTVLKQLRQDKVSTPIILVTAKGDELDRVLGLELGADDYITKPFSPREVVARLKAVLRRSQVSTDTYKTDEMVISIQDLLINDSKKTVMKENIVLSLTPREYDLLLYFAQRLGRVIDRETILTAVWGYEYTGESRMVDMHISNLRDKIESNPKAPKILKTVRGFGYTMTN